MRLTLLAVPMLGVVAAVAAATLGEAVPAPAEKSELRGAAHAARQAQAVQAVQAVQAFRAGRYAAAYARFASLADGGDVPSAQIALLMLRQGPSLFGSEWFATPAQQMRWNALVVNAARSRLDIEDSQRGD